MHIILSLGTLAQFEARAAKYPYFYVIDRLFVCSIETPFRSIASFF